MPITEDRCDQPVLSKSLRRTGIPGTPLVQKSAIELSAQRASAVWPDFAITSGGGTLEAAEAVCNTGRDLGIDLFEGLSSLVDQNLIQQMDRAKGDPGFATLETIRQYAAERLIDSGEEFAARRSHAPLNLRAHFLQPL